MNTLTELNTHLFAQLDRLNNSELKGEELQYEIDRSKAITDVSKTVVSNASIQLEAIKLQTEYPVLKINSLVSGLIGAGK